jgi:hypothetical protein
MLLLIGRFVLLSVELLAFGSAVEFLIAVRERTVSPDVPHLFLLIILFIAADVIRVVVFKKRS